MGINRRTGKKGRRIEDEDSLNPRTDLYFGNDEQIFVGGNPVEVPCSFGSDGNEHHMGMAFITPTDSVSLPKH